MSGTLDLLSVLGEHLSSDSSVLIFASTYSFSSFATQYQEPRETMDNETYTTKIRLRVQNLIMEADNPSIVKLMGTQDGARFVISSI